jgi:hypothetical protein
VLRHGGRHARAVHQAQHSMYYLRPPGTQMRRPAGSREEINAACSPRVNAASDQLAPDGRLPGTAVPTLDTHLHGSSRSVSGCANARPRKASDVIPSRSHDPYCRRSLLPPSNACLPKKRPADQTPAGRPHVFSGVEVSLGRRASVLGTSPGRAGCRGCSGGASRLTTAARPSLCSKANFVLARI